MDAAEDKEESRQATVSRGHQWHLVALGGTVILDIA